MTAPAMKLDYSSRAVSLADPLDLEMLRAVMRDPQAHGITRCIMCGRREVAASGFMGLTQRSASKWGRILLYVLCGECADTPDDAIQAHVLRCGGGVQ
jgi:hypothetical protein